MKTELDSALELLNSGKLSSAKVEFERLLSAHPDHPLLLSSLGTLHRDRGEPEVADRYYRKAYAAAPELGWIESNRLMTLNYNPACSLEEIVRVHVDWGNSGIVPPGNPKLRNSPVPDKRIHVGLVSGDLRWHSVAFFLLGLLEHFDRQKLEVTVFCENEKSDEMTDILRSFCDGWVETQSKTDLDFQKTALRSRIDVLIDLSGHTARHRQQAFALRCAPIQLSWLGYPTVTGNPQMDYWMTDSDNSLDSKPFGLKERVVSLDGGVHVYHPPVAPEELPLRDYAEASRDWVTLGCFNNRAKITVALLELWAEILEERPKTKLLLKSIVFVDLEEREKVIGIFESNGIDPGRIELLERSPSTMDHLKEYRRVDIALDTFPYNGTTTTFEALWMGVPVVTQTGEPHASRVGSSILRTLGRRDWITESAKEYKSSVLRLIDDAEDRLVFRQQARELLFKSGLTDSKRFSRKFEAKIRDLWRNYCSGK
ncbi:MAG: hypothetical protein MI748_14950 [Opitutales bacterium]|nr:hypothetical protein [Opitutales bacterium]